MTQGQDVFLRKATGLTREVGALSGMFFNIGQGCSLVNPVFYAFPWLLYGAMGNQPIAFGVGLIGGMLVNSVYAHFSAAMPRSGGEYVFLGRTMFPQLGFVVNWCVVCVFFFWETSVGLTIWPAIVNLLGFAYSPVYGGNFLALSAALTSSTASFIGASLIVIFCSAVAVVGMRTYVKMQNIIWAFGLAAIVVMAVGFTLATRNFPATFNAWSLQYVPTVPDMYDKIINDAAAAGFSLHPEGPWLEQTMVGASYNITSVALYCAVTTYIGGEIKRAENGIRQHIMMEGASIFLIVTLAATVLPLVNMVGLKWAASFFYIGSEAGLPLTTFVYTWYEVALGPYWGFFVSLMTVLTILVCMLTYVPIISRCLFAWSFDRVVPSQLGHVSDRWHTPTFAVAVNVIIGVILLFIANFAPFFLGAFLAAAPLWIIANVVIVCLAGAFFPYVRKGLYEKMPLKAKIAGIPALTIIGLCGATILLATCSVYVTNPAYFSSLGVSGIAVPITIFIYGSALIVFYVSRALNKRRGIDLGLAFKQIPPA